MASAIVNLLGGPVADGVAKIIGLFKVDPTVALEKHVELTEIQLKMQSDAAAAVVQQLHDQAAIDQTEAASPKLFIAGWRPFIGWVCGVAFAANYIILPVVQYVAALRHSTVALPALDFSEMMPVLLGMLGLGGLRTYEKMQGAAGNH